MLLPSPLQLEISLTEEQFWQLCQKHQDLQFERTATGKLIIMSPTGGLTGYRNADLTYQIKAWNRRAKLGKVFDSSTGFLLPNGANRSPDASWVKIERWDALTTEQKEKFVPLCPDFIVELRSKSDTLAKMRAKLKEYLGNGARLGWLIDPQRQVVEVYRPGQEVEILQSPITVSGEDVLPGFILELAEIF